MRPRHRVLAGSVVIGLAVAVFVGFGVTHLLARRAAVGATSSASPLIGVPASVTAAIVAGLVSYYALWRQYRLGTR